MAKPKPQQLTEQQAVILEGIHMAVDTLFKRRIGQVEKSLDSAKTIMDVEKLKITFPVVIDYSESVPTIKVGMAWSQTVRDDIMSLVHDPGQGTFNFITVAEAKAHQAENETQLPEGSVKEE